MMYILISITWPWIGSSVTNIKFWSLIVVSKYNKILGELLAELPMATNGGHLLTCIITFRSWSTSTPGFESIVAYSYDCVTYT